MPAYNKIYTNWNTGEMFWTLGTAPFTKKYSTGYHLKMMIWAVQVCSR